MIQLYQLCCLVSNRNRRLTNICVSPSSAYSIVTFPSYLCYQYPPNWHKQTMGGGVNSSLVLLLFLCSLVAVQSIQRAGKHRIVTRVRSHHDPAPEITRVITRVIKKRRKRPRPTVIHSIVHNEAG